MRFSRQSSEETPRAHAKDAIIEMILSRGYKVGDKLPSYRELARHFGIAPCTLIRALRELAEEGTVRPLLGKGVFVRKMPRGGGKLTTVGLVYPASQLNLLNLAYLTRILAGVMTGCGQEQIDLQIVAFRRLGQLDAVPVAPRDLALRVDGLMLLGFLNDRYIAECAAEVIPLVLVDAQTQAAPIPCVAADNAQATALVMDHLYGLGHRRIAYADFRSPEDLAKGPEPIRVDTADTRERREAYLAQLDRLRLDYARVYPAAQWDKPEEALIATGRTVLAALRADPQPPTAIGCFDEAVARGVYQALQDGGWRIPEDISIAAVATAAGSNLLDNQVITGTVIDFEGMGKCAVAALQRQTRRHATSLPQVERIGGTLCVGTTTAKPSRR